MGLWVASGIHYSLSYQFGETQELLMEIYYEGNQLKSIKNWGGSGENISFKALIFSDWWKIQTYAT